MIVLTFDGNLKRRVPKEKGNDVVRYSIVFRTVKTKEERGVGFEYDEQENEDGNGIYPDETQDNRDKYSCPKIP